MQKVFHKPHYIFYSFVIFFPTHNFPRWSFSISKDNYATSILFSSLWVWKMTKAMDEKDIYLSLVQSLSPLTVIVEFHRDILWSIFVIISDQHQSATLLLRGEPNDDGFLISGDLSRLVVKFVFYHVVRLQIHPHLCIIQNITNMQQKLYQFALWYRSISFFNLVFYLNLKL